MTQATEVVNAPAATGNDALPYVHVKPGHPRWNLAVTIGIIALILALSLIAAERLATP